MKLLDTAKRVLDLEPAPAAAPPAQQATVPPAPGVAPVAQPQQPPAQQGAPQPPPRQPAVPIGAPQSLSTPDTLAWISTQIDNPKLSKEQKEALYSVHQQVLDSYRQSLMVWTR